MPGRDDVDAVVLVGGQGTRLRPLTLSAPKPMLPTAGVPFLEHMLSRIRAAGITHVVLGTSYKAETFTEYFGDGSAFGLEIEYVVEDVPLGTGGGDPQRRGSAAGRHRDGVQRRRRLRAGSDGAAGHARRQRRRRHPAPGQGRRSRGPSGRCRPGRTAGCRRSWRRPTNPPTDQINAGCYVFKRSVIQDIPAGRVVSVERETFPGLLAAGARVFGHIDSTYWLDLGTPAAFVRGSADLVTGVAPTAALPGPVGACLVLAGAEVDASGHADRRQHHRPGRRRRRRGDGRRLGGVRRGARSPPVRR